MLYLISWKNNKPFDLGSRCLRGNIRNFVLSGKGPFIHETIFLYAELFVVNETYGEKTDVVRCVDLVLGTLNFVSILENVSAVSWFCTVSLCSYSFLLQLSSLLHSCVSLSSNMHVLQLFFDPINYLT